MTEINSAIGTIIYNDFICRQSLDLVEDLFSSLNIIKASS